MEILSQVPIAVLMGIIGAIVFTLVGVVSGTDETSTIAPLTLVVILLGVPPAGIFTFFIAAAVSKHMTHAIPTMLLGIPGDTLAVPIMDDANRMRALGVPHVALRKAISAALISAVIAVPVAVLFAWVLSPFEAFIGDIAPWLFLIAAILIAYVSPAKLAGVLALIPFVAIVMGLNAWAGTFDVTISTSYFMGIAIGPMIFDLFAVLVPGNRARMRRREPSHVYLAPDTSELGVGNRKTRGKSGAATAQAAAASATGEHVDVDRGAHGTHHTWPNPFKVLDKQQLGATAATSVISSATFVFSPVAMTVLMGELVGAKIKQGYQRLATVVSAKNGTTESTYMAETLIPLVAFGLPLSPVAAGPAAPLFNAPPVFHTDAASGEHFNLSDTLSTGQFFVFALLGVLLAGLIAYPFAMRYAHAAARFVVSKVSHEAIIAGFSGLVLLVSVWEGGLLGLIVVLTIGLLSGLLVRTLKLHSGVLFMGYYVAILSVPGILKVLG
ncbi:tripartite tricarboxylate transporter permease [Brevibacterium sp. 50QC2O2]|uniref:tripartite tricarboxylate transporter permease n=1 Tax=Brevibacterium sp. 50QC2O2 TaxID=2968459 RepID=UPI00211CC585|nr:tripartite tricarboxylate transporter permease [Brevibacterium sp. 50QC2O2]MCQ9389945.1 tripartite tricarboxylate transporter permease [Brevibacterium sp. 50QC2O2]